MPIGSGKTRYPGGGFTLLSHYQVLFLCFIRLKSYHKELCFGVKMVVSGKDMDKWKSDEPAIIIMNHRTRLDWMFFWAFMLRFGSLRRLKIILKEQLKLVPGLGWAMQNFVFIFIKRKWEQDEQYLSDVFSHYSRHHYPIQLLLFPEGTDFSHANREKVNKTRHIIWYVTYNVLFSKRIKHMKKKMGCHTSRISFIHA